MQKLPLEVRFLGVNQPYKETLELMHKLHAQVALQNIPNQLLLLEHEPVITTTRSHLYKSLKTSREAIEQSGIKLELADRGGDATFHGPGQLVGYPIIWLGNKHYVDIAAYVRGLELSLLKAMHLFGVESAQLLKGFTGVWVKNAHNQRIELEKLIAIGVGIKDGVTKHGFALNIDIDYARYVQHIVPCGLKDRGVATLKNVFCGHGLEMPERSVMLAKISLCLAQTFSLQVTWPIEENLINGRKYCNAPAW